MYELINSTPLEIREYNGQRVLTFRDIDTVHQRPDGTARKRFNDNKKYFIENVDFFRIQPSEIRTVGIESPNGGIVVTESGYLMVVKSFTDDLAWAVQRQLVNAYFRAKENTVDNSVLIAMQNKQNELEKRIEQLESKQNKKKLKAETEKTTEENAMYILERLLSSDKTMFLKHDVLNLCRKVNAKEANPALNILENEGFIIRRVERKAKRGRAREIIIISK